MIEPVVKCVVNNRSYRVWGDTYAAGRIDTHNLKDLRDTKRPEETECGTFNPRGLSVRSVVGPLQNVNWEGAVLELFQRSRQLSPRVGCEVDNCNYWAEGNECVVGSVEIWVKSEIVGNIALWSIVSPPPRFEPRDEVFHCQWSAMSKYFRPAIK